MSLGTPSPHLCNGKKWLAGEWWGHSREHKLYKLKLPSPPPDQLGKLGIRSRGAEATSQDISGLRGFCRCLLQRGRGCPCGCQAPQLHSHNPSFMGPGALGTQEATTVGLGMQSQQRPGEIRTMKLVRRDHPEILCAQPVTHTTNSLTGRDANLGGSCSSSPHPAAHLLRTGSSGQRRGPASVLRPLPAQLHTYLGWAEGPAPYLGSNLPLSLFRYDLGQVNFSKPVPSLVIWKHLPHKRGIK